MTVDAERERLIGEVLGLNSAQAATVVQILVDRDWLRHGIVAVGAAMAARWGVELRGALRAMADGRRLGAEFSDYELRVAGEEAADDVAGVWLDDGWNVDTELREQFLTTQSDQPAGGPGGSDHIAPSAAYIELPTAQ